jgi:co-chaperonin GroES (HSP10)
MTNAEAKTMDLDDTIQTPEDVSEDADDFIGRAYVTPEDRVLDPKLVDKTLVDRMPSPTGWRILVLPYRGKGKSDGGIIIPEAVRDDTQIQTVVGYVFKTGPLAYKDKEKFPGGPWCAAGDWVIFARYAGSRFRIEGGEVRILNDDEILASIEDPNDILSL